MSCFVALQLEISSQLYLETILNLTKFGADYSFGRLRLPVNKTEWITHGRPAVVNAYYSSIENSIREFTPLMYLLYTIHIK